MSSTEKRLIKIAQTAGAPIKTLSRLRLFVHHRNRRIAGMAIEAIGKADEPAQVAQPDQITFLRQNKRIKVGRVAVRCLQQIHATGPDVYAALRDGVDTPQGEVNKACHKALRELFSEDKYA